MAVRTTLHTENVSVPASLSGGVLFTIPVGAVDVTLTPSDAADTALTVQLLEVGGASVTPTPAAEVGQGSWRMRFSSQETSEAQGYDCANDSGGAISCALRYWI